MPMTRPVPPQALHLFFEPGGRPRFLGSLAAGTSAEGMTKATSASSVWGQSDASASSSWSAH